jgi:hypothetical protein
LPKFEEVKIGAAVRIRIGSDNEQWILLEDGASPKLELCEQSPSTSLAQRILSTKVGEQFLFREDPIQNTFASVVAIVDKYTFRVQEILNTWDTRFPDKPFFRKFEIPKLESGEPDILQFLKDLEKAFESEKAIQAMMLEHPLSATHYSRLTNVSIIESVAALSHREDIPIRCCRGDTKEYALSQEALSRNSKLVIEASALVTLFFSGLYKQVVNPPFSFVVTEGNLQLFRELVNRRNSRAFSERLLGMGQRGVYVHERSKEEVEAGILNISGFCDWLDNLCEIVGGEAQASLEKEAKEEIETLFGGLSLESVAVALASNLPIWTDDYAIAERFIEMGGVGRSWTDATFSFLEERHCFSSDSLVDLKLFLLDSGYLFTRINIEVVRKCLEHCNYDTSERLCSSLLRYIWSSGVQPHGALGVATTILDFCLKSHSLVHKQENAIRDTVAAIGRRADARDLLVEFRQVRLRSLETSTWAKPLLNLRIDQQLALLSRTRGIILPGDPDFGI